MSSTRLQRENPTWFLQRSCRLTASRFYDICVVKEEPCIIFGNHNNKTIWEDAMNYGIIYEATGLRTLSRFLEKNLSPCGLFISEDYPFIAGSPDAVIRNEKGQVECCIEIKCPYTSRFSCEPPKYILKDNETGMYTLDRNSRYFHQIQGQMFVTNCNTCIMGIYTPDKTYVLQIDRDQMFIEEMLKKLVNYYMNHCYKYLVEQKVKIPQNIIDCINKLYL
jgi:hypothetical protein